MTPFSDSPASPVIRNRQQLNAVVENIMLLQHEQMDTQRAQEHEIAAVREKYRAPLAELDRYLQRETSWVEHWAQQNPTAFAQERSLDCPHGTIGFRMMPPRVERANRKWTWSAAAQKLAEVAWGRRYLRSPEPEVDKEAIMADLAALSVDQLREVGLKIVEGERFFIEPHHLEENSAGSEPSWQEAA